ncbi:MAG: ATP-binding protein [Gammaproteobacteria bacterium]|nr:ATP-binding protein [Gammaproteobacteria bacterium]
MGQTRVDLRHLRDAYPGSIEETILTEVIANSLDSGAGSIRIRADTAAATLTVVDDGSGMRRRELARYHDLATSTKTRGKGIGFAGVGVKLGLLIGHEVVTESRTGATRLATTWSLTGRHKAPWHWLPAPPRLVGERGTAIRLHLRDPLSLLLDVGFVESAIRRHYEPLLDPALAAILVPLYRHDIAFEVNGQRLVHESELAAERADLLVRLSRRRKPSAVGWLVRESAPLPEDRRGLAVSTYGKVIKRGWDWLGVSPAQADRIGGLIEAPGLAECLTLNKGDFIRTGSRGSIYLAYRRAIQEAVVRQLTEWGDAQDPDERAQRRAARPVERDLEDVLVNLADEFPMLASLVEKRLGGQRRLPMGAPGGGVQASIPATASVSPDQDTRDDQPMAPAVPPPPATDEESKPPSPQAAELPAASRQGPRRPARYGLVIHYESRPDEPGLARLVDTVVWVNEAHPAYARAVASRSEGYHLALCVAMALAPLVTDPGAYPAFVTEFLRRWGRAVRKTPGARTRRR